jgi:hypothetical protein
MSSGVEFDEDKFSYGVKPQSSAGKTSGGFSTPNAYAPASYANDASQPRMVRFMIKHGLAKTPKVAQAYLVALVIIDFIAAFILIKYFSS